MTQENAVEATDPSWYWVPMFPGEDAVVFRVKGHIVIMHAGGYFRTSVPIIGGFLPAIDPCADKRFRTPVADTPAFPSLEGKQFIYDMHSAFPVKGGRTCITVKPRDHVATNVVQTSPKSWEFNLSGLEGRFETYYGWSLILDTPLNRERLRGYEQLQILATRVKEEMNRARNRLETLEPKNEPAKDTDRQEK